MLFCFNPHICGNYFSLAKSSAVKSLPPNWSFHVLHDLAKLRFRHIPTLKELIEKGVYYTSSLFPDVGLDSTSRRETIPPHPEQVKGNGAPPHVS